MEKPTILDVCCGGKMFYFDKNDKCVLFQDIRRINTTLCDGREFVIDPGVVADFTSMPYPDSSFSAVVFDIVAIARKNYDEIIASKLDNEISDKWYKCKVNFITLNERNSKEEKTSRCFLVQSASALTAHKRVDKFMEGAMSDYEVEQVYETKIIDVFKVATNEEEDGLYF